MKWVQVVDKVDEKLVEVINKLKKGLEEEKTL